MSLFVLENTITAFALFLSVFSFVIAAQQNAVKDYEISITFSSFSIITCAGYFGIFQSSGLESFIIYATKIKLLGAFLFLIVFFLLHSYLKVRLPKILHISYITIGFILVLQILTFNIRIPFDIKNPLSWFSFMSTWFFKSYFIQIKNGIYYLHAETNWGYHMFVLSAIIYAVSLAILYLKTYKKNYSIRPANMLLLFISVMMPDVFFIIEKAFKLFTGNDTFPLVPVGILISNVITVYLILSKRLYNLNSLATNQYYDFTDTPIIILDDEYRITSINQTARKVLPFMKDSFFGKRAMAVLPDYLTIPYEEYLNSDQNDIKSDYDSLTSDNLVFRGDKVFQPRVRHVRLPNGKVTGYILSLIDVTLIYNYKHILEENVSRKTEQIRNMRDQMVLGFSVLAEHHDTSSEGHLTRTSHYTTAIAQELMRLHAYPEELNENFVKTIGQVTPLHDIGKIYISSDILDKTGTLSENERILMQTHTILGAQFIETALKDCDDKLYSNMAHDIALYHHEWWNGSGYPSHKLKTQIPLCARIMAVSDVFDALTSRRSYKKAYSIEDAFKMIHEHSGNHFDPLVITAFENIYLDLKTIASTLLFADDMQ